MALVDLVEGMRRASTAYYSGKRVLAQLEADRAYAQIRAEATAVGDGSLDGEVTMAGQLAQTLRGGL